MQKLARIASLVYFIRISVANVWQQYMGKKTIATYMRSQSMWMENCYNGSSEQVTGPNVMSTKYNLSSQYLRPNFMNNSNKYDLTSSWRSSWRLCRMDILLVAVSTLTTRTAPLLLMVARDWLLWHSVIPTRDPLCPLYTWMKHEWICTIIVRVSIKTQ